MIVPSFDFKSAVRFARAHQAGCAAEGGNDRSGAPDRTARAGQRDPGLRCAAHPACLALAGRRAFTLLEVLLALAIMSVITVALFASLHVAFKARDRSEAALEPVRTSEAVMELVRAELESALPPRGKLVGAFVGTSWQAGGGLEDDELTFYATTTAPAGVFAPGDVKQVQLRTLIEQNTGRRVLVRRVVSNLLSPVLVEPDDEILCRGVASFDVIYYDGVQWWTTWDSTYERDSLPVAVQVTLQLDPPMAGPNAGNVRGPRLSRVIQFPCVGEADLSEQEGTTEGGDAGAGAGTPDGSGGQPGGAQ